MEVTVSGRDCSHSQHDLMTVILMMISVIVPVLVLVIVPPTCETVSIENDDVTHRSDDVIVTSQTDVMTSSL